MIMMIHMLMLCMNQLPVLLQVQQPLQLHFHSQHDVFYLYSLNTILYGLMIYYLCMSYTLLE